MSQKFMIVVMLRSSLTMRRRYAFITLTLPKTRFGAAFFKNAASGCCLSCVFVKRSSISGRVAAFIKPGNKLALKLRFLMLELRLGG